MANQTTDTSLNGGAVKKATSKVQSALENMDMDEIRSQVKEQVREIVRAGDEFRRTRPALFWGAVAGIGILIAYLALRPMSSHIPGGRMY